MEVRTPTLEGKVSYVRTRNAYRLRLFRGSGTILTRLFKTPEDIRTYLGSEFLLTWQDTLTSLASDLLAKLEEQTAIQGEEEAQLRVMWNSEQISLGVLPRASHPHYSTLFYSLAKSPTFSLLLFPLLPKNHPQSWWNPTFRSESILPRLKEKGLTLTTLLPLVKPLEYVSDTGARTVLYLDALEKVWLESEEGSRQAGQ